MSKKYSEFGRTLRKNTALSPVEIENIELMHPIIKRMGIACAYVGNVGVKSYISPDLRGKINRSEDTDIVYFVNNEGLLTSVEEDWGLESVRPIRRDRIVLGSKQKRTYKEDPFVFYRFGVPAGERKLEVDAFTKETGLTFIPLSEEDERLIVDRFGVPCADLGLIAASLLNPYASTKDRTKRVNYALAAVLKGDSTYPTKLFVQERYYKKLTAGFEVASRNPDIPHGDLEYLSVKTKNILEQTFKPSDKDNIVKIGLIGLYAQVLKEQGISD